MVLEITVKYKAESVAEMRSTFPSRFKQVREQFDQFHKGGIFGTPARVKLRHLVSGALGETVEVVEVERPVIEESNEEDTPNDTQPDV